MSSTKAPRAFAGAGFMIGGVVMVVDAWADASTDAKLIAGMLAILAGILSAWAEKGQQ